MKTNSLTAPVSVTRKRVQVSNPFTWPKVQQFYNAMPLGITPCKNTYEAKMYTCAILAILSPFVLPLIIPTIYLYRQARKGGNR